MLRSIIILCSLLGHHFYLTGQTPSTIHCIFFMDTEAPYDVGNIIKMDSIHWNDELKNIRKYTGMEVNDIWLTGKAFCKDSLIIKLDMLKKTIKPDDVFIISVNGHGLSHIGQRIIETPSDTLHYSRLDDIINVIDTRLKIVLLDCCSAPILPLPKDSKNKSGAPILEKNYKDLFARSSGRIDMFSCSIGEKAFADHNNGSFFTNAFLDTIDFYTRINAGSTLKWEKILNIVKEKVIFKAINNTRTQHPTWSAND